MNESSISVRYAKALFQSADEKGKSSEVLRDLQTLEDFYNNIPEFSAFIESPVIPGSEKKKFFLKITHDGFEELTRNFLLLITQNKRESYIKGMIRYFLRLFRDKQGILEALLITPLPAKSETLEQIRKILVETYKAEVEIREETNPDLIGGFVLRVEDQQLDASVAAQLKKVQRELDNTLMQ